MSGKSEDKSIEEQLSIAFKMRDQSTGGPHHYWNELLETAIGDQSGYNKRTEDKKSEAFVEAASREKPAPKVKRGLNKDR